MYFRDGTSWGKGFKNKFFLSSWLVRATYLLTKCVGDRIWVVSKDTGTDRLVALQVPGVPYDLPSTRHAADGICLRERGGSSLAGLMSLYVALRHLNVSCAKVH